MEKKQQILLGVVVVCVIGMGSIFLFRGGSDSQQVRDTGPAQKRVRTVESTDKKDDGTRERKAQRREKRSFERRERDTTEMDIKGRRRTGRRTGTEKKKEIQPAA